jgi:pyruvate-formate lyase-activating enzyme
MNNRYVLLRARIFWRILRKGKVSPKKILNALHCFVAFALRLQRTGKAPFLVNFELSNECNANCLFCRSDQGEIYDQNPLGSGRPIPKGRMPFEMYEDLLRQVQDRLLMAVLYMNGEPLLYKDLARAVRLATDLRVATMISTNGQLLTADRSREILEAGIDFVKVAVSGFTQDVFTRQVRRGNIEKVKQNIRDFVRVNREGGYGVVLLVDFIEYAYNEHQRAAMREFCEELGVPLNLRPGNLRGLERDEPQRPAPPLPLAVPCDWLWKVLSVHWTGELFPCCDFPLWSGSRPYETFHAGTTSLAEIWNGPRARELRRLHATTGRSTVPVCAVCHRRGTAFKY